MESRPSQPQSAIYAELSRQLTRDIQQGVLQPGDKLPPQRELADYLDLHLSTVTRAYTLCEEQGLICARVGRGTFVASDANTSPTLLYPAEDPPCIQLGTVFPPYNGSAELISFIQSVLTQPDIARLNTSPLREPAHKEMPLPAGRIPSASLQNPMIFCLPPAARTPFARFSWDCSVQATGSA